MTKVAELGICPCGQTFPIQAMGRPRKYCSEACKSRASNSRRSICRSCGCEFKHQNKGARFCPDCKYVARVMPDRGRALFEVNGVAHLDCTKCGQRRPLGDFPESVAYKHGRATWCRECYRLYNFDRRERTLEQSRQSRYGLSIQDQRALWAAQGGCCAACREPFAQLGDAHLDHDHRTGRVRGYLCRACNHILGLCREDLRHLMAVAEYLETQQRYWVRAI